jgi:capsular exopolysaccharide synthesis family protein
MGVDEELRTYLQVLWRYKWMIAACAIIASIVALGISLQLTPLYTATAIVRAASVSSGDYVPINSSMLTRLTNTLIEIANSDSNLDEVAEQLGLQKRPNVEVEVVPETELISISASDPDPFQARDIANKVAGTMIEQSVQFYGDSYLTTRGKNIFTIVVPASLPQRPSSPKIYLNTALGLLAGLATGVILAFIFEGMDDTLRGIEDVRAMTKLPILCMVPEVKRRLGFKTNLSFSRNGHLSPEPAFDQLRARLILSDAKPESTIFLITSPEPGTGKSTVATNLAVSLSEGGNLVVLVDMDIRRPRVHSILGIPNETGLSNFVRGDVWLDAILQTTEYSNLRVITAGSNPHVPSEWLTPAKIGNLLEMVGRVCDYVLIDAPAMLSVADTMVLASQVDEVILVVARRKTERQNLRFAQTQLAELKVKVAGIVLNKVPNSQLYRYYMEGRRKQLPFRWRKSENRKAVHDRSKNSSSDEN